MPFDVEAAKKAGYSDDEILSHLTASRAFDVQGALKSGYSKPEIISHLSSTTPRPVSEVAAEHLQSMASGPARQQFEQAQASATQDIKNSLGRAAGETAAMIPYGLATLATGGATLPLMAAAGFGSGVVREGVKKLIGSSEVPKGGDLALTLGIDTALGPLSELTGRGLNILGAKVLPTLLTRSAVKSAAGKALVQDNYAQIRSALDDTVGKTIVDIKGPVERAFAALEKLPEGQGALGEEFTGLTGKAAETSKSIASSQAAERQTIKLGKQVAQATKRQQLLENTRDVANIRQTGRDLLEGLVSRLEEANGRIGTKQPFDALIEMKGNIQQLAYDSAKLNNREQPIYRKLAEDLDARIRGKLASSPEALALYDREVSVGKALYQEQAATNMAQAFIQRYAARTVGGAAIGGAAGGYYGQSPGAAATGAAIGAGAASFTPKLATLILRQAMSHPQAAKQIGQSLEFLTQGKGGAAREAFERGMAMAGVRETMRAAIDSGLGSDEPIAPTMPSGSIQ